MLKLLHWELKNTLLSKKYLIMLVVLNVINILTLANNLHGKTSGYEAYQATLYNLPSFLSIIAALFAGMSISGGYQDRLAQVTVIAGYGRMKYTLSKSISYLIGIAIFCISALLITLTIVNITKGITVPTSITEDILLPSSIITIIVLGTTAIFLLVSFCIKSVGPAIGVGIFAVMGLEMLTSVVRSINPSLLKWLQWEQVVIILEDPTISNYIYALIISLIAIFIFIFLSGIQFKRVELK